MIQVKLLDNFDDQYNYDLDLEFTWPSCDSPRSPLVPENLDGSVITYTLTRSSEDFIFPEFIAGPGCCEINYDYQVIDEKGEQIVKNLDSFNRTITFEYLKDDLVLLNNDVFKDSQDYLIIVTASTGLINS